MRALTVAEVKNSRIDSNSCKWRAKAPTEGGFDSILIPITLLNSLDEISGMTLLPNPVKSSSSMFVSLESTESMHAEVVVTNAAGQAQIIDNQSFAAGQNQFEVRTDGLVPGLYFLQLRTEKGLLSQKFVVW